MWTYNYNNELYHYGVLGMKWGVRKNSPRRINKLTNMRDRLAADAKRRADQNFVAAKNVKKNSKSALDVGFDKNDVDLISKGFQAAGETYIQTNKKLLSLKPGDFNKKQLKDIYRQGYKEANKLAYGIDAFDYRDR